MPRPGPEAESTWAVAGLRVRTNRTLRPCPELKSPRWDVRILFDSEAAVGPGVRPGWHRAPVDAPGWIRADGRQVRIADSDGPATDAGTLVRWILPYAAALQGRVMLHAAAVVAQEGIHAFIGPSGAGKSTLASQLGERGLAVIADDLLLCLERRGGVVVPLDRRRADHRPLAAVHFLERSSTLTEPRCVSLSRKECFRRLLRHGFGELAVPEFWALQFRVCQRIAKSASGFRTAVPDDLASLHRTAEAIHEHLGRREAHRPA